MLRTASLVVNRRGSFRRSTLPPRTNHTSVTTLLRSLHGGEASAKLRCCRRTEEGDGEVHSVATLRYRRWPLPCSAVAVACCFNERVVAADEPETTFAAACRSSEKVVAAVRCRCCCPRRRKMLAVVHLLWFTSNKRGRERNRVCRRWSSLSTSHCRSRWSHSPESRKKSPTLVTKERGRREDGDAGEGLVAVDLQLVAGAPLALPLFAVDDAEGLSSTHDEDPPSIIVPIIVVLTSIISYLIVPISISIVDSTIVILVSSPIIVRSRSSLISFIAIRSLALLVPILLVSIPTSLTVMIPLSSIAFLPLIFLPIVTTIASIALIVLKSLV
nr:hypothetical protein Iba_chr10aCG12370 [Ipomoea batatas]